MSKTQPVGEKEKSRDGEEWRAVRQTLPLRSLMGVGGRGRRVASSKSSPAPRRTYRSQTSLPLSRFLRPSPSLPLFLFLSFPEPHLLAMV